MSAGNDTQLSPILRQAMPTERHDSLRPPESYVYTGPMSTAGRNLNRFALSLKVPERDGVDTET